MGELNYKKIQYYEKMKKRRRNTFIVSSILVISIILSIGYYIFYRENDKSKYLLNMGAGNYKIKVLKGELEEYEKQLNINEIDYKWNGTLEEGNEPTDLVFHHTASNTISPEDINKMHIQEGWEGIGYHFYIRKDGTIYRGRPENTIGAHAIGRNRNSIGICLEGNFETEVPTEEQKNSLVKVSTDMIIKYNLEGIIGHKDVFETLCPGKNFPMEEIKNRVLEEQLKMVND
ncbi:MAG TPA: peptidoglycan recognition family protein [Clostridium sp.]